MLCNAHCKIPSHVLCGTAPGLHFLFPSHTLPLWGLQALVCDPQPHVTLWVPFAWSLPVVTQSLTSPSSASSSSRLSTGSLPRAPSSACVWRDVLRAPLLPSACSPFGPGICPCSVPHLVCSQLILPQYSSTNLPSLTLPDPPAPSCSPQALLCLSHAVPCTAGADLGCRMQLVSSCCSGAQAACVQRARAGCAQQQPPTPSGVTQTVRAEPSREELRLGCGA